MGRYHWYSSIYKDSLVNLPANKSTAVNQAKDKIPPTMVHLNYNGNTSQIFKSYNIVESNFKNDNVIES